MSAAVQEPARTGGGLFWFSLVCGVASLVVVALALRTANYLFLLAGFVLGILTLVVAYHNPHRGGRFASMVVALLAMLCGASLPFG